MQALRRVVEVGLRERGFAVVAGPIDRDAYNNLAAALGEVVGVERIALRPGAHAYVAKPGRVPLHTDHPDVAVLSWWCEEQDATDGASLLLDAWPVVDSLDEADRDLLRQVQLVCPPLAGGPPTERRPVLRATTRGEAVFCSPWLRSAEPVPSHELALAQFREALSAAAKTQVAAVRLSPGSAIFVDNQRVLHGRGAIGDTSRRVLHRRWIRR